jgi:hypothetical protein
MVYGGGQVAYLLLYMLATDGAGGNPLQVHISYQIVSIPISYKLILCLLIAETIS